jgi:NAD(P)-dependent dehydrogenase (short-subunit alcohol dehydrogenase family)
VARYSPAEDCAPAAFSQVMKINLDGAFYTAQASATLFKKRGLRNVNFAANVRTVLVNIQKQAAVSIIPLNVRLSKDFRSTNDYCERNILRSLSS